MNFLKLIKEGSPLKWPVDAAAILQNKKRIEIQINYTNDLMESFSNQFEGNAWRHPKQHDLQVPGKVKVKWESLEEVKK